VIHREHHIGARPIAFQSSPRGARVMRAPRAESNTAPVRLSAARHAFNAESQSYDPSRRPRAGRLRSPALGIVDARLRYASSSRLEGSGAIELALSTLEATRRDAGDGDVGIES
jgi:hypothetical protein